MSERLAPALTALQPLLFDLVVALAAYGVGVSFAGSLNAGFLAGGAWACRVLTGAPSKALQSSAMQSSAMQPSVMQPAALRPLGQRALGLTVVVILAYFLRTGVAGLLSNVWHLPAGVGLAGAVLATSAVLGYGLRLLMLPAAGAPQNTANLRAWVVGIVCCSFTLRFVYGAQMELLPEEAYYWNYSRHLDIGYLDHPPMVAWLIWMGTHLLGDNELGVRVGAMACGAVASLFSYRLTRNLFGEAAALLALLLMQTLPFFFLSGILMTPDSPLTAAWAALLYCLERALIARRAQAWAWAGVALGLGLISKYTIALAAFATLLFVVRDPGSRHWLRRREPYAAAVIACALFAPVLLWNYQHDWASFAFQTSRRLAERPRFSLHKLLGSALVLIAPTGVLTALAGLRAGRQVADHAADGDSTAGWRLLRYWVCTPLVVFAVFSLRHEVKIDWTGAPWVAAVPAMAAAIAGWQRRPERAGARLLAAWPPTIGCLLSLYCVGFGYLAGGLPGVGYSSHMELAPIGWRSLGLQIGDVSREVEAARPGPLLIVGIDRYETASELAFYSSDPARSVRMTSAGHLLGGAGLMYERWFPPAAQKSATLLLVSWRRSDLSAPQLVARFDRLEPIHEGSIRRDGHSVRPYFYRVGVGFDADGAHGPRAPR